MKTLESNLDEPPFPALLPHYFPPRVLRVLHLPPRALPVHHLPFFLYILPHSILYRALLAACSGHLRSPRQQQSAEHCRGFVNKKPAKREGLWVARHKLKPLQPPARRLHPQGQRDTQ